MGIKKLNKIPIAILITATFIVFIASPVLAAQLKFKDVTASRYDWVRPYIEKMALAEIIKGMTDTSYAPDASITRAQTVTTMVRMMGWDNQAKGKQLPTSFPKPQTVPSWAKGYVALAVDKEIISGDDLKDFRANDATKRSELAVFAVKALGLGKEAENRKNVNVSTSFTDGYKIELNARAFVEIAIEKEIMKGYPDNTFKPNEKVTRAEMAKVLNNIAKNTNPYNIISGEVQDVDTILLPSITVKLPSGSLTTYSVNNSTSIYREDDKGALANAKLQDIKSGSRVHVIPDAKNTNVAVYVDVLNQTTYTPPASDSETVKGNIKDINTTSRVLTITNKDGASKVYSVKSDATVIVEGKTTSIRDLTVGQPVTLTISKNEIFRIEAENFDKAVKGILKVLNSSANTLTIENVEKDTYESYTLASGARIKKDGKTAVLYDIKMGDMVELTISDSKVQRIDAETSEKEVEGVIEDISFAKQNPVITVEDDRGRQSEFELDKHVTIRKNGRIVDIRDLKLGDEVSADLEYNKAVKITAKSVKRDVSGIVKSIIFSDTTTVTIIDDKGKEHTLTITRDTDIYKDRKYIDATELRRDYYLDIEVENDVAISIDVTSREVQNTIKGIVQNINEKVKVIVISVKNDDGTKENRHVEYTSDTIVTRGNREVSIRKIYEGDEIIAVGNYEGGLFFADTIINLTLSE